MSLFDRTIRSLTLLTFLLLLSHVSGQLTHSDPDPNEAEAFSDRQLLVRYLVRTLDAIEKAANYIGRHIEKLNLDGLIGVREVESKMAVLVSAHWPALPALITRKMRDLIILFQKVGDRSYEMVKRDTPNYFSKSHPLIESHFWDLQFPPRRINTSLIRILGEDRQRHTEKESDDCLAELFGTENRERCKISRDCWKKMTSKVYGDYSLTHEVFYLINGIHASCISELETASRKYEGKTVSEMLDYFCANVYSEALTIEENGFPYESMDLFMEQIGLCGDAGYMEIAKWRWLPLILALQRPNGCYGIIKGEVVNPLNFDPNGYGKSKRSVRLKKRVEQRMSADGCLSHRISVALSALITFVRRLTEHIARSTV